MALQDSPRLPAKKEGYRLLSSPKDKKYSGNQIDKGNPPSQSEFDWFVVVMVLSGFFFIFLIAASQNSHGVGNKDLGVKMDINNLTDTKKLLQFFVKHDTNRDQRLDTKELLLGMLHLYQDTLKKLNESQKYLSDSELSWMVDYFVESDGRNGYGSVYYSVLIPKEKKKSSFKFSFGKSHSPRKKWCPAKSKSNTKKPNKVQSPTKSPIKSPVRSPVRSPAKSPAKSPVKSPAKSPRKSPRKSSFRP